MNDLQRMKDMAAAENAMASWSIKRPARKTKTGWEDCPAEVQHLVPRVLSHLRDGDGAEDMQAIGTCSADEAWQVIAWFRRHGRLDGIYGVCRRDWAKQTK